MLLMLLVFWCLVALYFCVEVSSVFCVTKVQGWEDWSSVDKPWSPQHAYRRTTEGHAEQRSLIETVHWSKETSYWGWLFFTQTWLGYVRVFAIANLSVVCNVCAPYLGGWNLRQYLYLGLPLTSMQNLRRSSQGNPSVGGVKRKRSSKIERWWTYQRLYFIPMSRSGILSPDEFLKSAVHEIFNFSYNFW